MPDTYIEECVHAKTPVVIITTNGFHMVGVIVYDDEEYIVVKSSGTKRLIFKHAISTIYPEQNRNNS